MVCCFFGHRNTPRSILPLLRREIVKLLEANRDARFYVGNQGDFDRMAQTVLADLQKDDPSLDCAVVLAYLPVEREEYARNPLPTIYPEGLGRVPRRFAISSRNRWMVERADTVICYQNRNFGGAAQFVRLAARKGRQKRTAQNA